MMMPRFVLDGSRKWGNLWSRPSAWYCFEIPMCVCWRSLQVFWQLPPTWEKGFSMSSITIITARSGSHQFIWKSVYKLLQLPREREENQECRIQTTRIEVEIKWFSVVNRVPSTTDNKDTRTFCNNKLVPAIMFITYYYYYLCSDNKTVTVLSLLSLWIEIYIS